MPAACRPLPAGAITSRCAPGGAGGMRIRGYWRLSAIAIGTCELRVAADLAAAGQPDARLLTSPGR
jgi:hypothetical protein